MKYHPSLIKKAIETIEIIPEEKLGIVLTQDNLGFRRLVLFAEAYSNLGAHALISLKSIFSHCDHNFSCIEFPEVSANNRSSKRALLDYLNIRYLMLIGKNELRELVIDTKYIYGDFDAMNFDENISEFSKTNLLKNIPFRKISRNVIIDEHRIAIMGLVYELFERDKRKEYDLTIFKEFNEWKWTAHKK